VTCDIDIDVDIDIDDARARDDDVGYPDGTTLAMNGGGVHMHGSDHHEYCFSSVVVYMPLS